MSCHLSHRLTTVHRAVSMALLCSMGYVASISSAQAATIGKTVITSTQHEPLSASIVVTDIQSDDFSASLANQTLYRQMGLMPTDSMTVRFKSTSATSGQVFITTSKPVSKPFADVVLNINDNGQRKVIPKTLLMPLNDSVPIKAANNSVTGAKKTNLPSVSANTAKPLTVRKGAPPPMMSAPKLSAPKLPEARPPTNELLASQSSISSTQVAIQAPTTATRLPTIDAAPSQSNKRVYAPSRLDNGRLSVSGNTSSDNQKVDAIVRDNIVDDVANNMTSNVANNIASDVANNIASDTAIADRNAKVSDSDTLAAIMNDAPFDTLNIQITRQIQLSNPSGASMVAASPILPIPNNSIKNNDSDNNNAESNDVDMLAAAASNIPANTAPPATPNATANSAVNNHNSNNKAVSSNSTTSSTAQYQVQRNDSLWIIAQQIAQENNLDIQTVMKQIQSQNPNAFINKNADQLKADAKLSLPSYDVIPSQQKLEAAISAQRRYSRSANTAAIKQTTKKPSQTTQVAKRPKKPVVTKTTTLPKAQFSVLAPGRSGSEDGTQTKSAAAMGNGLSTDILATLKASRQSTAAQAQRLAKASSSLARYTKKIQLQNQKLAELQARLKKLRNQ